MMNLLTKNALSGPRLLPTLIGVSAIALTVRVADLYTGIGLLETPAVAQEAAASVPDGSAPVQDADAGSSSEQGGDGQAEEERINTAPIDGPVIIGLMSDEERKIFGQLKARAELLDRRERQLDLQQQTLFGVEKKIDTKIAALRELEVKIKEHLRVFDEEEAKQLEAIVQVYETMKPKLAAERFEKLDLTIQIDLASRMNRRKFSTILGAMSAKAASELTSELATQAEAPSLEDVQDGR